MKDHVGSTLVLTTVRSRPRFSAMYSQYCTLAPPSGSAPMCTPASRMASRFERVDQVLAVGAQVVEPVSRRSDVA